MQLIVFFGLLWSALAVWADSRPQVTVWTRGHMPSAKAVLPKAYKVLDKKTEDEAFRADGYLKPSQRDALFRKVGIETKLKALDELDKDLLVMGAPHYSVAELMNQYPMLTDVQLKALKREIGKLK